MKLFLLFLFLGLEPWIRLQNIFGGHDIYF
jgi:hypothetical protein